MFMSPQVLWGASATEKDREHGWVQQSRYSMQKAREGRSEVTFEQRSEEGKALRNTQPEGPTSVKMAEVESGLL